MKYILCFLMIFFIPLQTHALQDEETFNSSGLCTILMDMDSKRILFAENIHTVRSVASISKIMTAIVAIESGKLEDIVTIGDEINTSYGSGIYIQKDEQLKLIDLVYGLMLRSGNDAALAIAHYVGGSVEQFVQLMNEKAIEIGMKNSTFHNPSGLDEEKGNLSTAYDMALLTSYAMKNETYQKIVSTKKYILKTNKNTYVWHNKNRLLSSYKYATGGKTGFTEIARRTLVTTASKDNLNLVVVTLNDGNDFLDHQNLFEEAFSIFTNYRILKKGNIEIYEENYYPNYTFTIEKDFFYPLKKEEEGNIYLKFQIEQKKIMEDKEEIGTVSVYLGDEQLHQQPIYITAQETIKKGFFEKIIEWFQQLW